MALQSGQTLANYRLVEQIGEGGMGVVWPATDTTRRAPAGRATLQETP